MTSPMSEERRMHRALTKHVQFAAADLTLFLTLCKCIKSNGNLARCAHDFVWFTVRALRDAGVSHLYRLYDTQGAAVSLSRYIKAVGADSKQRKEDLRSISEANPLVKKLLRLRHEAIGHTSQDVLDSGIDSYINNFDLGIDEMQDLLGQAQQLLEHYSGRPMVQATPALSDQAQFEVSALDAFLENAIFTDRGIERISLERDDKPRSKGNAV